MLTPKGRLRCVTCGDKHSKRGDTFLTLHGWDIGPKTSFNAVEPIDMNVASHYCSWECLLDGACELVLGDTTPADITGDH